MRRLLPLALLVLAVLVPAFPARAAVSPPLVIHDEVGDELSGRASMDIASVGFQVKKMKPTDPGNSLVVTMTLAGPPETQLVTYQIKGELPGCGSYDLKYTPGTVYTSGRLGAFGAFQLFVCNGADDPTDSSDLMFLRGNVTGNTITWPIALDSIPKAARNAKSVKATYASTTFSEPIFGIYGNGETDTGLIEGVPNDSVKSDKVFNFA